MQRLIQRFSLLLAIFFGLMVLATLPAHAAASTLPEFNLLGSAGSADNVTTITSMDMTSGDFSGTAAIDGENFTVTGNESGSTITDTYNDDDEDYQSYDTIYLTGIGSDGDVVGNGSFTDTNGNSESYQYDLNDPEATTPTTTTVVCKSASTVTCAATVVGGSATGVVTFSATSGSFTNNQCVLAAGTCSVGFTPVAGPAPTISAVYSADADSLVSQGQTSSIQTGSTTSVSCVPGAASTDPGTCTALISSSDPTVMTNPTGTVTFSADSGTLAATSCVVSTVGGSTNSSSCSVHYQAPAGVDDLDAPEVDASYPGDTTYASSTGSQDLTCDSGAIFQVDGVESTGPHPNGYRILNTVTVDGCGLAAGDTVTFGQGDASDPVAGSAVNDDGDQLNVTIPATSTTGPVVVSLTTGAQAGSQGTTMTTTSTDPVTVDSWRNSNGFSFYNFNDAVISASDLVDTFPDDGLIVNGQLNTEGTSLLAAMQKNATRGACFGLALASGEFADGYLPAGDFDTDASDAFALSPTAALKDFIARRFLAQLSYQFATYNNAAVQQNGDQLLSSISSFLPDGNGFTQPAVVGVTTYNANGSTLSAHAEVAYGDTTVTSGDNTATVLFTADSNVPYEDNEANDAAVHQSAIAHSWMTIASNGNWVSPDMNMHGTAKAMVVAPVSALQGRLTLGAPKTGNGPTLPTDIILSPDDTVDSLADNGQNLDLTNPNGEVDVEALFSQTGHSRPALRPADAPKGISGIGILAPHTATTTLTLSSKQLQALWYGTSAKSSAQLTGGSGTVKAHWDQTNGQMALTPDSGAPAPKSTTLTLVHTTDGIEHSAIITGPAHYQAQLTTNGLTITSKQATAVTITLSTEGPGLAPTSVVLSKLMIHGATTITPSDWRRLTATVRLHSTHGSRIISHHLVPGPKSSLRRLQVHGRRVTVSVHTPKLLGLKRSLVSVALTVKGQHLTKVIPASTGAKTSTVVFTLHRAPRGLLRLTISTSNDTPTPTTTTTTAIRHLR